MQPSDKHPPGDESASGRPRGARKENLRPVPERFRVDRATLVFDTLMTYLVKVGGIAVIAAIGGIFVFLLIQIFPLFRGASAEFDRSVDLQELEVDAMGIDAWSELPLFVGPDGTLTFYDIADMDADYNRGLFVVDPGLPEGGVFPFVRFNQRHGRVLFGTDDGRFVVVEVEYEQTHPAHRAREVVPRVEAGDPIRIGREDASFEQIDYVDAGRSKLAVAIQRLPDGTQELHAVSLRETQPLIGDPVLQRDREFNFTELFEGEPRFLRVTGDSDFVIVGTDEGDVHLLARTGQAFHLRQTIRPFRGFDDETIHSMNFLFGDLSLIFTNPDGESLMYSVYHDEHAGHRILGRTKEFAPLPTGRGADFYSSSLRNKGFLVGSGNYVAVRYATNLATRWEANLGFEVRHALLGGRYDKMLFLDTDNVLHLFDLRDRHPETGWRAYFGKIHYEGRSEPEFMWQSTGGGDDFEPKLSMVPLIWGTLKGTVFAMIIAVPIALLAALYTSQFLKPEIRRSVKPVMEIMESVPTVVLGFLAALWMAPIISGRVPATLLVILSLPVAVILFGLVLNNLPQSIRRWIKPGYEFAYFAPVMFLVGWLAWSAGPVVEGIFFVVEDSDSGAVTADFRLWWSETTGLDFRQRNAFVVGIFMGFAIIPTIFTIAEDSMSNVPAAFRSGSLALGASRWQTAVNIVLPTAAAGIFSAVMIGFGRAVGETMILLMATGNTPIMTMNPFDGMRTLAANIAVELPEAAQGGSLYRSLFLGALLLFMMTFVINTLAELLRQRLRDRYKAVE